MDCVRMIPDRSSLVSFQIQGKEPDNGLMLLQRLYVLLFSDNENAYRGGEAGGTLLSLLEGGNVPPAGIMDARLAIACATAVELLDPEDAALVADFSGSADDYGDVTLTLELTDGTTIKGEIKNA